MEAAEAEAAGAVGDEEVGKDTELLLQILIERSSLQVTIRSPATERSPASLQSAPGPFSLSTEGF